MRWITQFCYRSINDYFQSLTSSTIISMGPPTMSSSSLRDDVLKVTFTISVISKGLVTKRLIRFYYYYCYENLFRYSSLSYTSSTSIQPPKLHIEVERAHYLAKSTFSASVYTWKNNQNRTLNNAYESKFRRNQEKVKPIFVKWKRLSACS